jgi:hypothetical protein
MNKPASFPPAVVASCLIAEIDLLIGDALHHNARQLTGRTLREALAEDRDILPAGIIRTGQAQRALEAARRDPIAALPELKTAKARLARQIERAATVRVREGADYRTSCAR